ncbi:MucBP domain-containing protein [Enterococcus wangshanyuanii]|uniref:BIG2 domain-containing protein n=1 Tax=Enterococcus wangshanyuanii TaxID=2005703 RepID=A0ABQ1NK16_9ENTE|nr:MucBP domain-containing protein [Enterococcus wangshanyuanii]GGC79054.1 hypothetical protein GCM10011573_05930 [Enterococcus wangshanyuanii]
MKKRMLGVFFGFMLLFTAICSFNTANAATADSVAYTVHGQDYGWQKQVTNGTLAGFTGKNKRLEAMKLNVTGDGGITYQLHGQDYGWQSWKKDGELGGSVGSGKRVEALKIQLTGNLKNQYDVYYRVHGQDYGWQNWKRNGELAGTTGQKKKIEAIEVRLVAKSPQVYYSAHGQDYGWQSQVADSITAGTTGKNKRVESLKINVVGDGGITYQVHGQDYGWQAWKSDGALAGTSGQKKRIEAIKIDLTGNLKQTHDIYYRVHGQDYGWQGWKKNAELAGTSGQKKKLEAIEIKLVKKETIPVTEIDMSVTKANLFVGEKTTAPAFVYPRNATDKSITYSSSNPAIATIDQLGNIIAVGVGSTKITATSHNGIKKSETVTVSAKSTVTFHYKDTDNNVLQTMTSDTQAVGTTKTYNAPSIKGYTAQEPVSQTIIFTDNDQQVTFIYKKNEVVMHTLTINYVYNNNTMIRLPEIIEIPEGETYTAIAPEFDECTLKGDTSQTIANMDADQSITFTYQMTLKTAGEQNIEVVLASLINQYRLENGKAEMAHDALYQLGNRARARELSTSFTPLRPDGRSFKTVIQETGIDMANHNPTVQAIGNMTDVGKPVASGHAEDMAKEILDFWKNDPTNNAALLAEELNEFSVGVYLLPTNDLGAHSMYFVFIGGVGE